MKAVDSAFKQLARRNTQQPTVRVTLILTSGSVVLGKSDIQSVKVTKEINGGKYCIGGTEAATMVLKAFTSSMPRVPETATYKVELGYVDDSGGEHFADYGRFATNSENVVRDGLWTTVTGYDAFYWMDRGGYDFGTADGSKKLSSRSMMGTVTKDTKIKYVSSEWSDTGLSLYRPTGTAREEIGQLAAANCANAVMKDGDIVTLRTPVSTGITLTANDYATGGFTVTTEASVAVSHLKSTFTRTYDYEGGDYERKDNESIECCYPTTSGVGIEINAELFGGGQFSSDSLVSSAKSDLQAMAAVGSKNNGLGRSFKGFSATLFGCCFLEPLDVFSVTDPYGETHEVCALSASWEYDGGIKTVLSASASAEDTAASSSTSSIANLAAKVDDIQGGVLALSKLTVDTLIGDNATFNTVIAGKLTADDAIIGQMFAEKADIDFLNVTVGWIDNGVIKNGAIGEAMIGEAAVTNAKIADGSITNAKIDALSADKITAGTLKTQYLILVDDEGENESIITALNAKAESYPGGVLDGAIVSDESITAAKITVADLKAFNATIGSFDIDDVSIHSKKAFIDDPTSGVFVGTTGFGLGDGTFIGAGLNGKASFDGSTGFTIASGSGAYTSDEGFSVDSAISGFNMNVATIFGDKGTPFMVYADGSVKVTGKNGKIAFTSSTGDLDIKATTLSIGSYAVATEDYTDKTSATAAKTAVTEFDNSLTQVNVFNRLTKNGTLQGIYMSSGNLYVNASYIKTGTLDTVTIKCSNSTNGWNLSTGDFTVKGSKGGISYKASTGDLILSSTNGSKSNSWNLRTGVFSMYGANGGMSLDASGNFAINATTLSIKSSSVATESYTNSKITALKDSISLSVSNASLGNKASITLSVGGTSAEKTIDMSGVRNAFKDDTSAITISAGTVTFNSNTLIVNSSYFKVNNEGKMSATSGTFSGKVTASEGTIGGFTLTGTSMYNGKSSIDANASGVYVGTNGICVGSSTTYTKMTSAGALTAKNANISGAINATSGSFSGKITSSSGTIGGFTLTGSSMYNSAMSLDGDGMTLKSSGSKIGNIGSNNLTGDTSKKGLVFELEANAAYMCWAYKESSTATTYRMVLTYANKDVGDYNAGRLHIDAPVQIYGNLGLNDYKAYGFWIDPDSGGCSGGITGTLQGMLPTSINSSGVVTNWTNNVYLQFRNGMLVKMYS